MDLFYPPEGEPKDVWPITEPLCERCGESFPMREGTFFECYNCQGRRWHLAQARAGFHAKGDVREAIHGFKYRGEFYRLPRLTGWLREGYERFFREEAVDGLVPVPLHPLRRRERGFNQAWELARALSKGIGVEVVDAVVRVKRTEVQATLRRSERIRNQKGAYGLKRGFDVRGRRLLMIDDVFTTGATVDACAKVLVEGGAERIWALSVARG